MSSEFPTWGELVVGGPPVAVTVEIACIDFDHTDGEKQLVVKGLEMLSGWVSNEEWLELDPVEKKLQIENKIAALQEQLNNIA